MRSPNSDTNSESLLCILPPLPHHHCVSGRDNCKTNVILCAFMSWNNQISQTLTQKPSALWWQSDVWWNDDTVTGGKRQYEERDGWMGDEGGSFSGWEGGGVREWSSDITLALINWGNGVHCTSQPTRKQQRRESVLLVGRGEEEEEEEEETAASSANFLSSLFNCLCLTLNLMD